MSTPASSVTLLLPKVYVPLCARSSHSIVVHSVN
jgi:hypothetical protein